MKNFIVKLLASSLILPLSAVGLMAGKAQAQFGYGSNSYYSSPYYSSNVGSSNNAINKYSSTDYNQVSYSATSLKSVNAENAYSNNYNSNYAFSNPVYSSYNNFFPFYGIGRGGGCYSSCGLNRGFGFSGFGL